MVQCEDGIKMFIEFLFVLRTEGVNVGISQWLTLLRGMNKGLATTINEFYGFARAIVCKSESDFDAYDIAFVRVFKDAVDWGERMNLQFSTSLMEWLNTHPDIVGQLVTPNIDVDDLWEELAKRLNEQDEEHHGGSHWVGTGGTSPFGHSGRASHGIRVGGSSKNRSAIAVAGERKWGVYRTDTGLEQRDLQMVLKQLRQLIPAGDWELDISKTIRKTVHNGGEIELEFVRERINRIHLVLLLDSGGSMEPYAHMVEQFFTAFSEAKGFKSFQAWHFHNVPYGKLYDHQGQENIQSLLQQWTAQHRVVWVGDACMAPYELMSPTYFSNMRGLDWIARIQERCPKSIWLNPESIQYWNHPTIRAISETVPMFPLTVDGLSQAVQHMR